MLRAIKSFGHVVEAQGGHALLLIAVLTPIKKTVLNSKLLYFIIGHMPQNIKCLKCHQETDLKLEQRQGIAFSRCQHCGAKNEIINDGGLLDGPTLLKPFRVIEPK
jgi:Zn finger protein HypA/HybF involved in hydrogenase expression